MKTLTNKFKKEAIEVSAEVVVVSPEYLLKQLDLLLKPFREDEIARCFPDPCFFTKLELADKKAGVSQVSAGIADTGSLIIDLTKPDHLVSLLPEHYFAILYERDLFKDIDAWLEFPIKPISWLISSGPSKTADIEQVLVYGAHGPMAVTILLVSEKSA